MNKIILGFCKAKSLKSTNGLVLLFALFMMSTQVSFGQQLLQWNTVANVGTETTESSTANNVNIAAANLTKGFITSASNANRFGGGGWFNTGNTAGGNTLTEAVAGNDYIQFVVSPGSGYSFTPTSLVFRWDRSGTGPTNVTLRSSADGYTANLGSVLGMPDSGNGLSIDRTITITGLTNITTATTFRIYGYGATGIGGTGGFDCLAGSLTPNVVLNGSVSVTWDGTSWSNTTGPDSGTDAIINGTYNTNVGGVQGPFTTRRLTVNSEKSLTINSGNNITVQNEVINNGVLVVENNANLIQVNNTANTGSITVNRNSSLLKRLDYTLWSSPVTGTQTLAGFSPLTSQSPSRFYTFNTIFNTGGVNGAYAAVAAPTTATFTAGAGYLIRMPNTADEVTPGAFAGQFTGVPNNGDIAVSLVDGLVAGLRYNLVGNPYPSTLKIQNFVFDNTANIESTLYFWRKTNGTGTAYCTWVAGALVTDPGTFATNGNAQTFDPLDIIQTGQGFFVEAKSLATTVTFKNSQRVESNNDQFFKTKQLSASNKIWLNATSAAGNFSQMAITYSANATLGVDAFDGKYINDSKFALTSNINDGEFTIQGRPSFDSTDVVALNFKTDAAGEYKIAIDHVVGVFTADQDIYLVDNKIGTETNLKNSSYTFAAASGVDNTRFSLKFQKTLKVNESVFNDNTVAVYAKNGTLYVNTGNVGMKSIEVYNVQGKLVAERKNLKENTATVENLKVNNQVLLVKVSNENNVVVTKKVMY